MTGGFEAQDPELVKELTHALVAALHEHLGTREASNLDIMLILLNVSANVMSKKLIEHPADQRHYAMTQMAANLVAMTEDFTQRRIKATAESN